MTNASRVVAEGFTFTEDPRWHDGRLWFSDFYGHAVHSMGPDDDVRTEVELDDQPSGLGWLPDGRLLVVAMTSRRVLRRESDGSLVTHAELGDLATWWCNDMLVAPSGLAYVGHFGFDLDAFVEEHGEAATLGDGITTAHVLLVRPDGMAEVAADEMRFPNGTVLTDDGATLVVAETLGLRLTAFDVDPVDGRLANRRVWADLAPELVPPDGICLDAEGAIWVANALGTTCVRVLEGGEVTDRVEFSQRVFACNLGGPDGTTLYACTAPDSDAAARTAERTARIEAAQVAVPGAGSP